MENTLNEELIKALQTSKQAFIQVNGSCEWSDGWKISVQGKTVYDAINIVTALMPLFAATKVSFKIATQIVIDSNSEQSTKLVTIYIPNNVDPKSYAELVKINLTNYEGAQGIPDKIGYIKYSEGIYYRNDRDSDGNYVYPNGTK